MEFDDGAKVASVLRENVRSIDTAEVHAEEASWKVGDRVEARANEGQDAFKPGKVTRVRLQGRAYDVEFDDGAKVASVLRENVRSAVSAWGDNVVVTEVIDAKSSIYNCEVRLDGMGLPFAPDHSWIGKLTGRNLVEAAEILICEDIIGCMDVEAMGEWKRIVAYAMHVNAEGKESSDTGGGLIFINLFDFADMWNIKTSRPLSDRVLSALLVCCGYGFVQLIGDVADILNPPNGSPLVLPSDRVPTIKKLINSFGWTKLAPLLQEDVRIELNLLRKVLQEQEALLSVWTVQMARILPFIEELGKDVNKPVSAADLKGLANRLGMPSLSANRVAAFAGIALTGMTSEVRFDASGAERAVWCQLQIACSHRRNNDPIREYFEQIDMLINPEKRNTYQTPSASILATFNALQKELHKDPNYNVDRITLPSSELCTLIRQSSSFLTEQVVMALCLLWSGDLYSTNDPNGFVVFNIIRNHAFGSSKLGSPNFVSLDTVSKFLYPFKVSVRCTSVLGKAHYKRIVRPYDSTDILYTALKYRFSVKFKKMFATSVDARTLKVPSDLRLYCIDALGQQGEEIFPSKFKMVAEVCGEDSLLHMASVYVESCHCTHNTQLDQQEETSPPSTTQKILDMIANPSVVTVKAAKPFPYAYDMAHSWTVSVAYRYLEEVMELPQYETNFLRYEINGYALLCLDEQATSRCCGIEDELHSAKVALHADNLRRHVFKTALKHLPPVLRDWHPVHIAALLQFRYNCPNGAVSVLRQQLDGNKLANMAPDAVIPFVSKLRCSQHESKRMMEGLNDILGAHLAVTKGKLEKERESRKSMMAEETCKRMNEVTHSRRNPVTMRPNRTEEAVNDDVHESGSEEGSSVSGEVSGCSNDEEREPSDGSEGGDRGDSERRCGGDDNEEDNSDLDDLRPPYLQSKASTSTSGSGIPVVDDLSRSVHFSHADTQLFDRAGNAVGNVTRDPVRSPGMDAPVTQTKPAKQNVIAISHPEKKSNVDPAASSILAHITALHQVAESHSEMVKSLQHENKKLRKEKERADAFFKKSVSGALTSPNRGAAKRDTAPKSYANASNMYLDDLSTSTTMIDSPSGGKQILYRRSSSARERSEGGSASAYRDNNKRTPINGELPIRTAEKHVLYESNGLSMAEELAVDADQEAQAWRTVLSRYGYDEQPLYIDQFDDSLTVLRRVAIAWMRLGKLVYDDAAAAHELSAGTPCSDAIHPFVMSYFICP